MQTNKTTRLSLIKKIAIALAICFAIFEFVPTSAIAETVNSPPNEASFAILVTPQPSTDSDLTTVEIDYEPLATPMPLPTPTPYFHLISEDEDSRFIENEDKIVNNGERELEPTPTLDPNFKAPAVALTFDDGPSWKATTKIFDTLETYGARATFFVVGSRVEQYKSQIVRGLSLGCEYGNHTMNHKNLTKLPMQEVYNEIYESANIIASVTGEMPTLLRVPFGEYNKIIRYYYPQKYVFWSIDTLDWSSRNAKSIAKKILDNIEPGMIIAMNDLYDETAEAMEIVIPELIARGYSLMTVSEMYAYYGEKFVAFGSYSRINVPDFNQQTLASSTTTTP